VGRAYEAENLLVGAVCEQYYALVSAAAELFSHDRETAAAAFRGYTHIYQSVSEKSAQSGGIVADKKLHISPP
jgi:hypothetical protein